MEDDLSHHETKVISRGTAEEKAEIRECILACLRELDASSPNAWMPHSTLVKAVQERLAALGGCVQERLAALGGCVQERLAAVGAREEPADLGCVQEHSVPPLLCGGVKIKNAFIVRQVRNLIEEGRLEYRSAGGYAVRDTNLVLQRAATRVWEQCMMSTQAQHLHTELFKQVLSGISADTSLFSATVNGFSGATSHIERVEDAVRTAAHLALFLEAPEHADCTTPITEIAELLASSVAARSRPLLTSTTLGGSDSDFKSRLRSASLKKSRGSMTEKVAASASAGTITSHGDRPILSKRFEKESVLLKYGSAVTPVLRWYGYEIVNISSGGTAWQCARIKKVIEGEAAALGSFATPWSKYATYWVVPVMPRRMAAAAPPLVDTQLSVATTTCGGSGDDSYLLVPYGPSPPPVDVSSSETAPKENERDGDKRRRRATKQSAGQQLRTTTMCIEEKEDVVVSTTTIPEEEVAAAEIMGSSSRKRIPADHVVAKVDVDELDGHMIFAAFTLMALSKDDIETDEVSIISTSVSAPSVAQSSFSHDPIEEDAKWWSVKDDFDDGDKDEDEESVIAQTTNSCNAMSHVCTTAARKNNVQEEEEELSRSNDEIDETMALASKQPKPSSLQQAGIKRNAAPSPPRIEVVSSSMTNKLQTAPPPASKKRKLPRSRIVFGGSGWMDN